MDQVGRYLRKGLVSQHLRITCQGIPHTLLRKVKETKEGHVSMRKTTQATVKKSS